MQLYKKMQIFSNKHSYQLFYFVPIAQPCDVKQIAGNIEVNAGTVVITFSADALATTFRCKLDKGKFKTCKLCSWMCNYIRAAQLNLSIILSECSYIATQLFLIDEIRQSQNFLWDKVFNDMPGKCFFQINFQVWQVLKFIIKN